jgi:hypothetical protein
MLVARIGVAATPAVVGRRTMFCATRRDATAGPAEPGFFVGLGAGVRSGDSPISRSS